MKTISDEERKTATLVAVDSILSDVDDTEAAFNDFRAGFQEGEEPGTVRAFELQIDERGNVGTTRMQTRLGSWPIDAYKFDELCSMLIDQYMTPDQGRMAVRLVGTRKEQTGYVFNKIVMLKRALKGQSSRATTESTGSLLKAIQDMSERNLEIMRRMQPTPVEKDSFADLQKLIAVSAALNGPMMTMMQALLPALAGRPAATASGDPFANLSGLLEVVEKLDGLRGGSGSSGGGDDDSFAGILRAITPLAKPALEALPAIASLQAANRPAARIMPSAPASARPPPPGSVPTPTPIQPGQPGHPDTNRAPPIQPTDIPSGDSAMLAQLKPQIDSLVAMAAQGSDATGAADLIFDQVFLDSNLPDELYEKLADFIDSEKFVDYVVVMNPAAKPHVAWFAAFKAQIVRRLEAETASIDRPTLPVPPG